MAESSPVPPTTSRGEGHKGWQRLALACPCILTYADIAGAPLWCYNEKEMLKGG